jgi:DNA-binding NtrC family response regulator
MKILVIDNDESHIDFFKKYLYQYDVYFSITEEETLKALKTYEYSVIYINNSVQNTGTILQKIQRINNTTKIIVHSENALDGGANKPFVTLVPLGFCVRHKPYSLLNHIK